MKTPLWLRLAPVASVGLVALLGACSSSSSSGGSTTDAGTASDTSTGADTGTSGQDSGATDGGSSGETGTGDAAIVLPTLTITSPSAADGGIPTEATTTNAMNQVIAAIGFATTNFTLAAPGTCGAQASSDNCGHVHVFVDGSNCTPDGAPYNNDAISSPADAILSSCPTATGTHSVLLELHHDDHSPIVDPSTMMTISASLTFTAQ